jgi:hypothetical protein
MIKCELRNVKTHVKLSEETECFSATLYLDGKAACEVGNRGTGGPHEYRWLVGRECGLQQQFEAHVTTQPALELGDGLGSVPCNSDIFVDRLLGEWDIVQQLKRWCKKDVVFRLKSDKSGAWRTFRGVKFTPDVKAHILKLHGDALEEIANERFQAVCR